ncbi:hypothetical protein BV22DRAFT_1047810 [Leucogyrophana mollusca]|uniref:Uncharacterized protein n=1 Tax=Leucogyrophana mollusca TaxID=85980 RepID=A0ACB8BEM0_9AGAM|nr:hypothetical protein BV22DRAFT_1047810 [Leucogyrophana mollusca]
METFNEWTDLLPFYSGFVSAHQSEDAIPTSPPSPAASQSPIPPMFRSSSFESSAASSSHKATYLVSTSFPPGSPNFLHQPDLILVSSDSVFFHIHRSALQDASAQAFHISFHSLPRLSVGSMEPVIAISESSTTLTIVLHTIYGMSSSRYSPSFAALSSAVASLAANEISVKQFVTPSSPLGFHILAHAPLHPLEVYALAAHYDLHDLAVASSSHLLSSNLATVTDEMAVWMGPRYLRRLFLLHFDRIVALKNLLMPPPYPHPATTTCTSEDQSKVMRAWALATAYLIWDSRVDLSTTTIKSVIGPIEGQLQCSLCRDALMSRMKSVVVQWTNVRFLRNDLANDILVDELGTVTGVDGFGRLIWNLKTVRSSVLAAISDKS